MFWQHLCFAYFAQKALIMSKYFTTTAIIVFIFLASCKKEPHEISRAYIETPILEKYLHLDSKNAYWIPRNYNSAVNYSNKFGDTIVYIPSPVYSEFYTEKFGTYNEIKNNWETIYQYYNRLERERLTMIGKVFSFKVDVFRKKYVPKNSTIVDSVGLNGLKKYLQVLINDQPFIIPIAGQPANANCVLNTSMVIEGKNYDSVYVCTDPSITLTNISVREVYYTTRDGVIGYKGVNNVIWMKQ
jgi:hypothetical protein